MSHTCEMPRLGTAAAWRDAARGLLAHDVSPGDVTWRMEGDAPGLFDAAGIPRAERQIRVPKSFVSLADSVVWHSDGERFALLYGLLWRLRAAPRLMQDKADPGLRRLQVMAKAVHRCQHKMKAFVRFREVEGRVGRRAFAAWFEPTHHTIEPTAGFFQRRFADMDWCIATPGVTVTCTEGALSFALDQSRPDLPDDAHEALWTTYYSNIFNPARLKIGAMTSEMPKKYWKNMPETRAIPDLIAHAESRAREMAAAAPTLRPVRADAAQRQQQALISDWERDAPALETRLAGCTRCPLHAHATQAVPGEGPIDAPVMIVGEQPGDQEDLAGRPFVGPAGQLFDEIAESSGLTRDACYLTNAVKHFKYQPRGKRRIHQRPDAGEVQSCSWWLTQEIARGRPRLIVAMGATAAQALTGSGKNLLQRAGRIEEVPNMPPVLITVHPSFILRSRDEETSRTARAMLLRDLAQAAHILHADRT